MNIIKFEFNPQDAPSSSNSLKREGNMEDVTVYEKEKAYKCPQCPKQYGQEYNLERHMRIHDPTKQLKCEVCFKVFLTQIKFDQHGLTHNKQSKKPYKCRSCPRRFTRFSDLNTHGKTHVDPKNFKCRECEVEKWFVTEEELSQHMLVHSGGRHKCFMCSWVFTKASSLKAHERSHTRVKLHKCEQCKVRYISHSSLKRHLESRRHLAKTARLRRVMN